MLHLSKGVQKNMLKTWNFTKNECYKLKVFGFEFELLLETKTVRFVF